MEYLIPAAVLVLVVVSGLLAWAWKRKRTHTNRADEAVAELAAADMPFGEDIENPDARVLPAVLTGRWAADGLDSALVIEPGALRFDDEEEQVVAVRFIGPETDLPTSDNVAVVTRNPGGDYALHMLGLSRSGGLVDLENMDFVLTRAA